MPRLEKKIALVTGGAGGIGAATARHMAREGACVTVADIHDEAGEAVVREIRREGGSASFAHLDVTREEQWVAVIEATVGLNGGLDVLVNNAGIYLAKGSEEASLLEWHRICAINLTSVVMGTKLALAPLRESAKTSPQGSVIVNMSSVAGIRGSAIDPLYSMTKGGVTTFTKATAIEFGRKGYRIRVNSVHPDSVRTEMTAGRFRSETEDPTATDRFWRAVAGSLPIQRVATPSDVAAAVVFLASDEAGFMTGSSLVVDGGATA